MFLNKVTIAEQMALSHMETDLMMTEECCPVKAVNVDRSGSSSPAIEKTLYVDSVCMLESSNSCSSSSDMKELLGSAEKDSELLLESEKLDKRLTLEACLREDNQVKNLNERDLLPPKMPDTAKSNLLSFSEDSIVGASLHSREGSKDKDGFVPEAKSLECSKVLINRSPGSDMPEPLGVDGGDSYASFLQSPLPPPLPKSPSESWLCRTLPSVSSMDRSGHKCMKREETTDFLREVPYRNRNLKEFQQNIPLNK